MDFIKRKNVCLVSDAVKRKKNELQTGRGYSQTTRLTEDWYLQHAKNFHNSAVKKKSKIAILPLAPNKT